MPEAQILAGPLEGKAAEEPGEAQRVPIQKSHLGKVPAWASSLGEGLVWQAGMSMTWCAWLAAALTTLAHLVLRSTSEVCTVATPFHISYEKLRHRGRAQEHNKAGPEGGKGRVETEAQYWVDLGPGRVSKVTLRLATPPKASCL